MRKEIFALLIFCSSQFAIGQTGKAVVEIENIKVNKGGDIAAAVFNKEHFLKFGKQITASSKRVTAIKMTFVFENLPVGDYAFAAYQDIDQNKSMKTNIVGYPKEPFGISNNPSLLFGPPSFEESKVKVAANKITTLKIKLR